MPADPEVPPHGGDADAELPENWQLARAIALRKLTTRAHTRHELDQALQAKNVPPSVKDAVLDRCKRSVWSTMLRLQLAGLPLVSSVATYPVGSSGENSRLRESTAATIDRALDTVIWMLSLPLLATWSSASARQWAHLRGTCSIGDWPGSWAGVALIPPSLRECWPMCWKSKRRGIWH